MGFDDRCGRIGSVASTLFRPERFRELDEWLAKYRSLWETRLDRLGAALEEHRKRRRTTHKIGYAHDAAR